MVTQVDLVCLCLPPFEQYFTVFPTRGLSEIIIRIASLCSRISLPPSMATLDSDENFSHPHETWWCINM